VDTEEYDPVVIAHELGHYVAARFSRDDTLGGKHALGDRLDPRVAFSEGLATGFATTVLGSSLYRDSIGFGQSNEMRFDIEMNGVVNPGWYSEGSVQAILWDLMDAASDGDDAITLPLRGIWDVLVGPQRASEALTTVFPFITRLKESMPASAAAIDRVVATQSIVASTMDIYGATETNSAGAAGDVLPVFTPIVIGGETRIVNSTNRFWETPSGQNADPQRQRNRLAVHRFLRLTVPVQQTLRITVEASRNADAWLSKQGLFFAVATAPGNEDLTLTLAAGTYILDVFDAQIAGGTATSATTTAISVRVASN
jgi:hypothetical protein